jgi:flagellar motor switch protein FliM
MYVGNRLKFHGTLGFLGIKKAIKIMNPVKEDGV